MSGVRARSLVTTRGLHHGLRTPPCSRMGPRPGFLGEAVYPEDLSESVCQTPDLNSGEQVVGGSYRPFQRP